MKVLSTKYLKLTSNGEVVSTILQA